MQVGHTCRRGGLLARIESSESLQVYPVYSTVSGVVAERGGNPGDMTHDTPLYVITNPGATTVVFNIFPRALGIIRPGMRIEVDAQDGRTVGATALGQSLSEGNAEAGTRSEERRVGKECDRTCTHRWARCPENKKKT